MEYQGSVSHVPAPTDLNEVLGCRGIKKEFRTKKTVKDVVGGVDLSVAENEFVVLFGPGQCGKTTLIDILAGLQKPTEGQVCLNGQSVTRPGPDRGVVYQKTALFPWLTVEGNVRYGPKVRGKGREECERLARHYIDLVGLTGFENEFPVKLSGGMRQRVGIARAYANAPAVLLMDEPFGHLDAQTRYVMEAELMKIWEKEKRTVIFVTNNIEEALYLADRIILLTNCPTRIKKEYIIDLPRPRDYVDPEFLKLRREITEAMDKSI